MRLMHSRVSKKQDKPQAGHALRNAGAVTGAMALGAGLVIAVTVQPSSASVKYLSGITTATASRTIDAGTSQVILAECPAGDLATGGGGESDTYASEIQASVPNVNKAGQAPNSWGVTVYNESDSTITAYAWVVCAKPS